jgi:alkylated DNA nucleotide flippase Atl1
MTRSAIEKRDQHAPAKVEVLTAAKGASYPAGRMLISAPLELDAVIRRIPAGRVLTLGALRANLARNHRADYTCPLTTGIFLRIVAEAAEEERATIGGRIAPYWRVVRDDGALIDKLPGGVAAQARRLAAEGVVVLHLGKVPVVSGVDHFGWDPPQLGKAAGRRPPAPAKTAQARQAPASKPHHPAGRPAAKPAQPRGPARGRG